MKIFYALAAAALLYLPAQARAQSYDEIIANQDYNQQTPSSKSQQQQDLRNSLLYGEAGEGDGGDSSSDTGDVQDDDQRSYDEMAIGEGGAKDLYSYVGRERGNAGGNPEQRRAQNAQKAHQQALKERAATLRKMQAGSQKLLSDQKKRAWQLAHPDEDYPGDEEADAINNETGDVEDASYSPGDSGDDGDAEAGEDGASAGGEDESADSGGAMAGYGSGE